MITCRQLIEFLDSYVEAALPEGEARSFAEHLKACPSCVAYLDSYRRSIELGKSALSPDADAVEAMPEELVRAVLSSRPKD